MNRSIAALLVLVTAAGCGDDAIELTVDLKTDFAPTVEFSTVRTELFEGRSDEISGGGEWREAAARTATDYLRGARVAEYAGLSAGERRLRLRLLDASGAIVTERVLALSLDTDYGVTVIIARDCRGVVCPETGGDPSATTCLGGRCVGPGCRTGDEPACGDPECAAHRDCDSGAACAESRCVDGVCLFSLDDGACDTGMWCNPELGCTPLPDGVDGGPAPDDAGPAPEDAGGGVDAGPTSCPGECVPGADESEVGSCGMCGSQTRTRTCNAACGWDAWGAFGACAGEGSCSPGASEMEMGACGMCGSQTRTRTCNAACGWDAWGAFGACGGEGVCSPGATDTETGGCGNCGSRTRSRTCNSSCAWGAFGGWGACSGEGTCSPGARQSYIDSCGTCGTRGCWRACTSSCTWPSYTCGSCTGDVYCTDAFGRRVCSGSTGSIDCTTTPGCYRRCTCSGSGTWISCSPGCIC